MALSGHMIRTLDRGLAIRIGLGVGGAYVAGSLSVLGFLAFAHSGSFSPEAAWMPLLRNNPDPRPAMAAAEIRADQTGRRYYSGLSLWLDSARPPPASR
jgi:hypothetical protein